MNLDDLKVGKVLVGNHIGRICLPTTKIPSENCLYKPARSGRKSWMYKDPDIAAYQSDIVQMLSGTDINDIPKYDYIELHMIFFIKTGFLKRDTTNMVKATEDAIVRSSGTDDAYHFRVSTEKLPSPNEKEYILISITGVNYET